MIAMQYSFTLPADYDMAIIRRRIVEKGPLLDHFDGLLMKAYLYAERGTHGPENLYAPFYVWRDSEAMQRFLGSAGFAHATRDFGWPSIRCWPVWNAHLPAQVRHARSASREILTIPPHASLDTLRRDAHDALQHEAERQACAGVNAFEPTHWTQVRLRLFEDSPPAAPNGQRQWYAVGHVSQP